MEKFKFFIVGWIIGGLLGILLGLLFVEGAMRHQAIANNAAEYRVNKTTGEVKFVWLTAPPK